MSYPTITRQMLADFTGRPLASFPEAFVTTSAIPQATLLFKIGTCLASLDDLTEDQQQLALYAIMSMADAIHLSQPYQTALASPFSSESIGSYSYSKVAKAIMGGLPTSIGWFDLAIDQLSVCDVGDGIVMQGGIEMPQYEGMIVPGSREGNIRFLSPMEIDASRSYGYDPAPGLAYTHPNPSLGE